MKVAIVHDYLTQYGGAERVLDEFKTMFPDAPVFVSVYEPSQLPEHYRSWDIRTSWLNRIPGLRMKHRSLLPLLPDAFESFDLSEYDLVLTSASGVCHGVLTGPQTCKITYCHSPARFLWDFPAYAKREAIGGLPKAALQPLIGRMRQRDLLSSLGTDYWITTSRVVQQRVAKTYRRSSVIIPPPVDVSRFDLKVSRQGYFLMLMRLVGWKRPEIVIEACNRLGFPLVVAGDGRELARLKALAGPTVTFAGRVNDEQMRVLYADCRALILPAEEDFGITPLEAMASGKPVIAYRAGGALDTVVPGKTGMFFKQQSTDFLMEALTEFNPADFDAAVIRRHAERYDSVNFRRKMLEFIRSAYSHYCTGGALVDSQLPSVEAPKAVSAAAV